MEENNLAWTDDNRHIVRTVFMLVGVGVLIRLIFMGIMDAIPEEAYYWSYAQHFDIGYLDHPPMVAWLIWLSTSIFGTSEFAVRLPAFIGWLVFAGFLFKYSVNLLSRRAAYLVLILAALLPVYFSIGYMMTPDAPMYVFWMACLFFIERALVAGQRSAWWAVGICMGLGLLSKYSIGLLGLATIAYMILDKNSWHWWKKPEPYLAAVLALLIFSPVLYWNYHHAWMSFMFQGPRRWSGRMSFSVHLLLGGAIVLLSPVGLYDALRGLFRKKAYGSSGKTSDIDIKRKFFFVLTFTMVPLLVFVINSFRSQPKLNWTGPVWLAVLPVVGLMMTKLKTVQDVQKLVLRRAWSITFAVLIFIFAGGFTYIVLGMPGVHANELALPTGWEELYKQVDVIAKNLEVQTHEAPVIVGMDHYWITSEMAFYGKRLKSTPFEVAGRHLFDDNSLMWDFWAPKDKMLGRNMVVVGFDKEDVEKEQVASHFESLGDVHHDPIKKDGEIMSWFYWRIGYGYKY